MNWDLLTYYLTDPVLIFIALVVFVAGGCSGLADVLVFDFKKFKEIHPDVTDSYWDPRLSWQNQYKNGVPSWGRAFPGSRSVLRFTTGAYNMVCLIEKLCLVLAISLSLVWWVYLDQPYLFAAMVFLFALINRAGYGIVKLMY